MEELRQQRRVLCVLLILLFFLRMNVSQSGRDSYLHYWFQLEDLHSQRHRRQHERSTRRRVPLLKLEGGPL